MDFFRLLYGRNLENEAKFKDDTALMDHPFMCGEDDGTPFIVFKFRDGKGWNQIYGNNLGGELYLDSIMNADKE
jgi:hypothetical protein